ncbi:MAG: STAS/SEC14 domain-containing protein [Gemmataceae bacterium]
MFERLPQSEGKVYGVKVSETITHEDYQGFIPQLEELIAKYGKIRVVYEMEAVLGFTPKAAWDDIKFDWKHSKDIERCAVVGDKKWEKWMTNISKPFFPGEIKYFPLEDAAKAWAWVKE